MSKAKMGSVWVVLYRELQNEGAWPAAMWRFGTVAPDGDSAVESARAWAHPSSNLEAVVMRHDHPDGWSIYTRHVACGRVRRGPLAPDVLFDLPPDAYWRMLSDVGACGADLERAGQDGEGVANV